MVVFFIGEGLASCSIYLAGQLHNETVVESKEQTEGTLGAFYIYQNHSTSWSINALIENKLTRLHAKAVAKFMQLINW